MNKRILFVLLLMISSSVLSFAKKTPDWVKQKPVSDSKYIGISRVALTDEDCRAKATQIALDEISAQISTAVESEAFMRVVDVDGVAKELFEKKINQSVSMNLEGQKLVDTYEDKDYYYVYYELDKSKFAKVLAKRRSDAISYGMDMLQKGKASDTQNDLVNAALLYAKGLEHLEPYLNLDLVTYDNSGKKINVPSELYNSFRNVFAGMTISSNVSQLEVEAFKSSTEPIAVCLSRGEYVIPNVQLNASFISGSGKVTPSVKSDYNGTAIFYIQNVTSKESVQMVEISIDKDLISALPDLYKEVANTANWPTATVTLALTNANYSAYFLADKNEIESCESYIRTIFANNYFELTDDTNADIYIRYSSSIEKGNIVAGDLYDFNEYFATLKVSIFDNKNSKQLLEYNISKQRVLVPEHNSESQAKQMCARELIKKAKVELANSLKKLNYNN